MFSISLRKAIRKYELERVLPEFPANSSVLEIGAGAGWQAAHLNELGFRVSAVDLEVSTEYSSRRVFPVQSYDGKTLPFKDNCFDVVFSSNVLEHIREVEEFQSEMQRVLKPDGIAVHILPSPSWRALTFITHYPAVVKWSLLYLFRRINPESESSAGKRDLSTIPRRRRLLRVLYPGRHGERGNGLSEMYYFSSYYWKDLFNKTGWRVERSYPTGLSYSGNLLFGELLSVQRRSVLSAIFGSSCKIYLLKQRSGL